MPVSQLYLQSRKMPFVRLLLALAMGIALQWYLDISLLVLCVTGILAVCAYIAWLFLLPYQKFRLQWIRGMAILIVIVTAGSFLSFIKNPLHQSNNYTKMYHDGDAIIATVNETLLSKPKTYKANVIVNGIYQNKKYIPASGTVIVYFDKTGTDSSLQYGSQILFTRSLQAIQNAGNPGAFDYQRYLLFQGITAQVYLKSNEYKIISHNRDSSFKAVLLRTQSSILRTIQTYIPRQKEQGVAEALLIGYRNDLDKQLVQSYSNTGVVHIIAISGLHLGMIYGFILFLFSRFRSRRWYRFTVPVIAIVVLWLFTLLAGAVPSILRSAVTFTFVAVGVFIGRKSSIYNTLAASAFCLLITNPFYLWDVGFQLSYAAVLGITMFTRPLSNCLYFENKLLSKIWLSICVTLAAQVLTLPVVLYNFHQFPFAFLVTNLLVVFLSELILFALLFLLLIGGWAWLATLTGAVIQAALWLMNTLIERTEKIPFSIWSNIKTDVVQAWLLYLVIILTALWLMYKRPRFAIYGLSFFLLFLVYTSVDIYQKNRQQKLIVYNIPKHTAIDIIAGRQADCFYDDSLSKDLTANNFTIKPAHTLFRTNTYNNYILTNQTNVFLTVNSKTIFLISRPLPHLSFNHKLDADIVIITSNPKLYIDDLCQLLTCHTIVADNNTSKWKLAKWKQACDSLHIRFHSVSQEGAFMADL